MAEGTERRKGAKETDEVEERKEEKYGVRVELVGVNFEVGVALIPQAPPEHIQLRLLRMGSATNAST